MKLIMKREKYSSLDGRTKVSWSEVDGGTTHPFTITATPSGIKFTGDMTGEIETMAELQAFAKLVSDVQKEWDALRTDLLKNKILVVPPNH